MKLISWTLRVLKTIVFWNGVKSLYRRFFGPKKSTPITIRFKSEASDKFSTPSVDDKAEVDLGITCTREQIEEMKEQLKGPEGQALIKQAFGLTTLDSINNKMAEDDPLLLKNLPKKGIPKGWKRV